jgi:hypothetical protein
VITEGRIQNSCGEVLLSPAKGNRGAFPRRIASCREYDAFFVRRAAGQRAPEALIPDPARGWMNCNAIRCRSFVVFGKSVAASPALSTFPNRFSCSERSRSGSASTRKTTASRTACSPISGNGFPCSIFTEANSSSSPLAPGSLFLAQQRTRMQSACLGWKCAVGTKISAAGTKLNH